MERKAETPILPRFFFFFQTSVTCRCIPVVFHQNVNSILSWNRIPRSLYNFHCEAIYSNMWRRTMQTQERITLIFSWKRKNCVGFSSPSFFIFLIFKTFSPIFRQHSSLPRFPNKSASQWQLAAIALVESSKMWKSCLHRYTYGTWQFIEVITYFAGWKAHGKTRSHKIAAFSLNSWSFALRATTATTHNELNGAKLLFFFLPLLSSLYKQLIQLMYKIWMGNLILFFLPISDNNSISLEG